ncbi:putative cyclin-dependent kinase F-2 [Lolium rigidum]|uniref:putative cyclin-dependent kinase F-2 n=1 Tax=Lolium rigidum TaxID=89674 RepID=UPI001F5D29D9|nr:putative cyclin-dependent kinase F-2 [Lolium rigidum]XP_047083846.1 putative cyclin-dependent kinase F-2 [Lolium rigidum]
MAVGKRPAAAVLNAGHVMEQGSDDYNSKRRRVRVGSMEEYEATDVLGEGAFGIVKKARHCVTGKTVAIKFIRPDTDASELQEEGCFLEACAGNPYVVGSYGLVREPNTTKLSLVMEYVGPSLHASLSKRPPLPESVVRRYMWQLLTGAQKMHERGIVHRDIKPANILVGEDGKILKLCDLGLALSLATEKTPYGDAGTTPYMAPEMLLGKPDYDARVDTWSLGCVMAEMLAGGKMLFSDKGGSRHTAKISQLWDIFRLLGLPDERAWPELASLPLAATFLQWFPALQHNTLGERFHEEMLSRDGFQVLKGLLDCNPEKRLTAAAALRLPWFLPEIDNLPVPGKMVVRIKLSLPATPKKKNLQRIKIIPPGPATQKMKKVKSIKNIVAPATPKKKVPRIKFITRATPKTENVLRIPLAMWEKARLMDPCKC